MDQIQFLFYFDAADVALFETKRLGLSSNASLSEIYRWTLLFKEEGRFVPLTFKSMNKTEHEQLRSFREADLKFTETFAKLTFEGQNFDLKPIPHRDIHPERHQQAVDFLLTVTK